MKEWVPEKLIERIEQYKRNHEKIVLTDKRDWIDDYAIPLLNRFVETKEGVELCVDDEVEHVAVKILTESMAMSEDDEMRIVLEIADAIFINAVSDKVEIILWFRCWDYRACQ